MMTLKRHEKSNVVGGQSSLFARPMLPASNCTLRSHSNARPPIPDEIEDQNLVVGSVYEIDHTDLPTRSPVQLKSMRIVMVTEKTDSKVVVRYPSVESVRTYFNHGMRDIYPLLDEKLVMGVRLAEKVLRHLVPSHEFSVKKQVEEFWLVNPAPVGEFGSVVTKKDDGNGMVRWGARQQVMYTRRRRENSITKSSSFVQCEAKLKSGVKQEKVYYDEDEEGEGKENVEEAKDKETQKSTPKRKGSDLRRVQKLKQIKCEEKQGQVCKAKSKRRRIVVSNPADRWSTDRVMVAEECLLNIMREKGAVKGNPILRPALRAEARKRIGDTGLLDHLLKHVAGKVAPGGADRFRRWHNAEGSLEYWLESADLINIRKEAGVTDPFWTPPPGWKPGDSLTQDPVCAKELNLLREDIANMKREMKEMVSRKQFEEELGTLRREMEELISKKQQEESQTKMASDSVAIFQKLDLSTSSVPSDSEVNDASFVSVEKYKEQLLGVSDFLRKIEVWVNGEISKATTKIEGKTRSGTESVAMTEASAERENQNQGAKRKNEFSLQEGVEQENSVVAETAADQNPTVSEEKTVKFESLKSGFRSDDLAFYMCLLGDSEFVNFEELESYNF